MVYFQVVGLQVIFISLFINLDIKFSIINMHHFYN